MRPLGYEYERSLHGARERSEGDWFSNVTSMRDKRGWELIAVEPQSIYGTVLYWRRKDSREVDAALALLREVRDEMEAMRQHWMGDERIFQRIQAFLLERGL